MRTNDLRSAGSLLTDDLVLDWPHQANKTPEEIESMIRDGSVDILLSFSEACRAEPTNLIASSSGESVPTSSTSVQRTCRLEDGAKMVALRVDTKPA